ncbi:hypothetical protein DAPPUDRAFT_310020 [Daphnia pulex]|uniref:Mitotic checkpoint protein BUB3 n=1 Tax=Daphnia pulex TaxID=6669 RepID=E9FRG3_DAPPU|nr:hypothetical protein DAPPUDRAFT_310020 [Daphnia pulex]|eukprot:EFX90203.1 hypothetical protein DAPPUDRAFT_310020 [Daphnia pulex]
MADSSEIKLKSTPGDGISAVRFCPNSTPYLIVSSWDGSVRLYDCFTNNQRLRYNHDRAVLDACFQDAIHSLSGGLDGVLKLCDLNSNSESILGIHQDSIRCVEYSTAVNQVFSGSWDASIKSWDPRSKACLGTHMQGDSVYTMALNEEKLVVGTAGRRTLVWDLRNMSTALQKRESSLKYQTRCIKCFPSRQGFVLSSIEGRVAVEYFDPSPEVQKKKYAFKCHRIKEGDIECCYSVNAISFHCGFNTFATGGSDGHVNIWDGFNKKRLCQYRRYPTSISSLSFSFDGSLLAIASSYMYEQGEPSSAGSPEDAIYIRKVQEHEVKPK